MAILGFALTEAIALLYETTRVLMAYKRYSLPYKINVPNNKFLYCKRRSNNIYLTMHRIIYKSPTLCNGGSFYLERLDLKLKSYLQTKTTKNSVTSQFWYNTSRILKWGGLVQTWIRQCTWSVAKRHKT